LNRAVAEVEDLASRVVLLKGRFAQQKVRVEVEHYWKLECVRKCFAELKRRIVEFVDAEPGRI
jgi:hypothetical protein